jgi:AraC-like DNA-binding protein
VEIVTHQGPEVTDRSFSQQFQHTEDSTANLAPGSVCAGWNHIVERHMLAPWRDVNPCAGSQVEIAEEGRFKGRLRSGHFGQLRYGRVWSSHGRAVFRCLPRVMKRHTLTLLVSGTMQLSTAQKSTHVGPGDFVLVNDLRHVVAENDTPIEAVILFDPLISRTLDHFGDEPIVRRCARNDAATMLSSWLQDACADRGLRSEGVAESMARVVHELAWEVMHERPVLARPRLDRQAIERQVARRLDDPMLSLRELADTFHCSPRTLHRVFRAEGEDSLERYIMRQRLEACAMRLRSQAHGSTTSLTDLALQFCFASSSHFSSAFRAHFGVTPSSYRTLLRTA